MATYGVWGTIKFDIELDIEADSETEAKDKAKETLSDYYHLDVVNAYHTKEDVKFDLDSMEDEG